MELLHFVAYCVIALLSAVFLFLHRRTQYWAERNVVHEHPNMFYGNLFEVGRTQCLRDPFYNFYMKYKDQVPFGGFYLSMRRAVVLFDLDLIKNVLIKDFNNFAHRGNYYNERDDPLTGHLFNLDGPKWRKLRAKLTPTFTSGKMKFMFGTVVEVAERFMTVLGEHVDQQTEETAADGIEIKELLARFTTDVIGCCAFGLECNSLKDPETKFRVMGKKVFQQRRTGRLVFALVTAFPELARKLHIKIAQPDVTEFFMRVVRETVEYRDREKVQRNDFMNLLMELRNNNETEGLSIEEIAAQAFVFFLAGFETSSSTMGFVLYCLALNQDIQEKVRLELNEMLERYDNKFTYEGMGELKYLQQVLHETMRLYSIASIIVRKTIADYPVPDTKHIIEKGTVVIVPVDAIHRDPAIYPEPELFNPERFRPEEIEKRHSMTWLPFGEGPRNCIGSRFGEMQAIVGLVMLLRQFRFRPANKTPIPMEMDKKNFILSPKDGQLDLSIERV